MAVLLTACSSGPTLRDYELVTERVEIISTPFFSQDRYQCGPAALATVLVSDGVKITPAELVSHIYIPERKGSLQVEIIAATRRFGRIPYVLTPDLQDLLAEVADGKPVLVMQNLGISILPRWHYAVVIGYDISSDSILLRSGREELLSMKLGRFLGTWSRARYWALRSVRPDEIPVTAKVESWLNAASAFEELGKPELAAEAYEAAIRRWPEEPLVWAALASAHYMLSDLSAAENALRHSVQLQPTASSHNNLAYILHQRGCLPEALHHMDLADSMEGADEISGILLRTRQGITKDLEMSRQSTGSCQY